MIKSRNKFTIVACARWESPYIIEWINYYRKIGFDRIFLYCNDDNPTELYEKLLPFTQGNNPFVTFRFYPDQGQQLRMYAHFLQNDRENTDWISFFDVDEYLRLPHGMQIDEFVDRFDSSVDCIMFNWVFFGPDGHKTEAGTSILREYKRRQSSLHPFTKYVARSSILTGPKLNDVKEGHGFWHCPMGHVDQPVNAVNVLGEDMSTYYDGFPSTSSDFVNDPVRREKLLATAVVHHYAFRSEAAFSERVKRGLGGAFDGQTLWGELAASDRFDGFLAGLHEVEDRSLVDFWPEYLKIAQSTNVLDETVLAGMPLSRSKPATQSSISEWSVNLTPEADARGAVNGVINGQGKFHTDLEDAPWWQVDLDRISGISEIRLFNRMDQRERANRLAIDIGLEAGHLIEIYRRESDEPFGGVDGNPLIFKPTIPIPGRFVRIRLLTRNYLHLDQVEIWGEPLPGLADRAAGTA